MPVSQSHAGHYGSAAWSPDGKRLASLAQLDKKGPFQIITIRNMATGEERDLKPALPDPTTSTGSTGGVSTGVRMAGLWWSSV